MSKLKIKTAKTKKCPFCGSDDIYLDEFISFFTVGCSSCGFHNHGFKSSKSALRAWDKRVSPNPDNRD